MIQRIIKSNSLLLAPFRSLYYPDFYDHLRKIVIESGSVNYIEFLKNMQVNQPVIKKTYIYKGFLRAVNVALGFDKFEKEVVEKETISS